MEIQIYVINEYFGIIVINKSSDMVVNGCDRKTIYSHLGKNGVFNI